MKLPIVFVVLLSVSSFAAAQSEHPDLRTLLQDSAYLFNRYEEITSGMDIQIDDWNIPQSLKVSMKQGLSLTTLSVSTEKPKLNALLSQTDVSASDLLDVYSEVEDLATRLSDQSSNFEQFGNDEQKAMELAKLGGKAGMLAENLRFVLGVKINILETEMSVCRMKASSRATKHK